MLTAVCCAIAACASPEPQPAEAVTAPAADTVGIRAAIETLGANIGRAHETRDAELYAASWAEDGIMSSPGSPPVYGRDSIVAAFRRQPPLPPGFSMTIHPTEIQIMNPEWAYVMGVDTLTHAPQGSAPPLRETFTFLVIVRKTGEGWQTYREVLTAN